MDAFAVSVSAGTARSQSKLKTAVVLAAAFGFFQALMPLIGWYAGNLFSWFIYGFAHYAAFILLCLIGAGMIKEGLESDSDEQSKIIDIKNPTMILLLAIATSIDALAAGLSFSLLNEDIYLPAVLIGMTTFAFSFAGVYLGERISGQFGKRAEIAGGIVLILIGAKILIENLLI